MSASTKFELDELLERVKGVRYFYALGHGSSKHPNPILNRIAEVRARLEALEKELKEGRWTEMNSLSVGNETDAVFALEQEAIAQQVVTLRTRLSISAWDEVVPKLGLQPEIEHAFQLIAHSRVPTTHPTETRNRLACLSHAEKLIGSIEAALRLNKSATCIEKKVPGVRGSDGAWLLSLHLRLENNRARAGASGHGGNNDPGEQTETWEGRLEPAWYPITPTTSDTDLWTNTVAYVVRYEQKFDRIQKTRDAYEQQRSNVITTAHEVIDDGRRDQPIYEVSNDTREEIRQLACRFLRPVDKARLNPDDCAIWTKLVATLGKIEKSHFSTQTASPASVHHPTARVPGVGVFVIDHLRRRP